MKSVGYFIYENQSTICSVFSFVASIIAIVGAIKARKFKVIKLILAILFSFIAFILIVSMFIMSNYTEVPNVTDLISDDARNKLVDCNLRYVIENNIDGKVIGQRIPAGAVVKKWTTVPLTTERIPEGVERDIIHVPNVETLIYNNHTYAIIRNYKKQKAVTWNEAKEYCESFGGYLAIISSKEENEILYQFVRNQGYKDAIFGYSDVENEGDWIWSKETDNTYTNWNEAEPNDDEEEEDEDCAEFFHDYLDGTWNDASFGCHTSRFICEWDGIISG